MVNIVLGVWREPLSLGPPRPTQLAEPHILSQACILAKDKAKYLHGWSLRPWSHTDWNAVDTARLPQLQRG